MINNRHPIELKFNERYCLMLDEERNMYCAVNKIDPHDIITGRDLIFLAHSNPSSKASKFLFDDPHVRAGDLFCHNPNVSIATIQIPTDEVNVCGTKFSGGANYTMTHFSSYSTPDGSSESQNHTVSIGGSTTGVVPLMTAFLAGVALKDAVVSVANKIMGKPESTPESKPGPILYYAHCQEHNTKGRCTPTKDNAKRHLLEGVSDSQSHSDCTIKIMAKAQPK